MKVTRTPEEIAHLLSVVDLLEVAEDICRNYGVRLGDVVQRDRHKSIVAARFAIWYAMRHHPDRCYSWHDIARLWGCDHTSVIHGVAMHQKRTGGALPKSWHKASEEMMCIAGGW